MPDTQVNHWKCFDIWQRLDDLVVFAERGDGKRFSVSIVLSPDIGATNLAYVEGLLRIAIERLHNEAGVRLR